VGKNNKPFKKLIRILKNKKSWNFKSKKLILKKMERRIKGKI